MICSIIEECWNFQKSRRKFDVNNLKLNFHTDLRSKKISCIKANSQTAFVFYDPKIKMQLRMKTISTINHQNKVTLQVWNQTKLSSRKCYLTLKAPSSKTLIPEDGIPSHIIGINPSQEESEEGFKNFVVVENKILHIDWLHLSFQGHRRLFIDFINSPPKFQWLIP